jgi:hypothetical protein
MVESVLVILTQPFRMHNSAYHEREFVAFLTLSSLPLKRPEDYTIRWNLTVTHAISKYLYAYSDVAFTNRAQFTIFFVNTNY